jgi:putative transposase
VEDHERLSTGGIPPKLSTLYYDLLNTTALRRSLEPAQYASGDYQRVLAQHGIVCSMSRRGDCWDNAVAESFFATLKVELVHDATWATRTAARTELFDYLEVFYNGQRRHSALGYLSPRAFERRREQEAVAT